MSHRIEISGTRTQHPSLLLTTIISAVHLRQSAFDLPCTLVAGCSVIGQIATVDGSSGVMIGVSSRRCVSTRFKAFSSVTTTQGRSDSLSYISKSVCLSPLNLACTTRVPKLRLSTRLISPSRSRLRAEVHYVHCIAAVVLLQRIRHCSRRVLLIHTGSARCCSASFLLRFYNFPQLSTLTMSALCDMSTWLIGRRRFTFLFGPELSLLFSSSGYLKPQCPAQVDEPHPHDAGAYLE